jgi:hypothetical protein
VEVDSDRVESALVEQQGVEQVDKESREKRKEKETCILGRSRMPSHRHP